MLLGSTYHFELNYLFHGLFFLTKLYIHWRKEPHLILSEILSLHRLQIPVSFIIAIPPPTEIEPL